MATFDRSQWISQGKNGVTFLLSKDLAGRRHLSTRTSGLHSPASVLTIQGKAPDTSAFFSKHPPDMMDTSTILRLCYLDMPSISVVRRLVIDAKQAWPLFLTGEAEAREEIVNQDLFAENEEDLTYNDESDVPIEVLINHVTSGGVAPLPDGFVVGEDGDLARNGAAEDLELDVVADDLPLAVRRPKRATKAPTQYGGDEMWEEVSPPRIMSGTTKFQSFNNLVYEEDGSPDSWPTWETQCQAALVLANLWGYISGRGIVTPPKQINDMVTGTVGHFSHSHHGSYQA
ncbi:hypothetical protein B0H10DRAFT_2246472 [Mycena sp. CBHHK59/15]|nr:hypothetical protein B0H10DRAFT_2246472 [Mycena sp. CBHHK59/15]